MYTLHFNAPVERPKPITVYTPVKNVGDNSVDRKRESRHKREPNCRSAGSRWPLQSVQHPPLFNHIEPITRYY